MRGGECAPAGRAEEELVHRGTKAGSILRLSDAKCIGTLIVAYYARKHGST